MFCQQKCWNLTFPSISYLLHHNVPFRGSVKISQNAKRDSQRGELVRIWCMHVIDKRYHDSPIHFDNPRYTSQYSFTQIHQIQLMYFLQKTGFKCVWSISTTSKSSLCHVLKLWLRNSVPSSCKLFVSRFIWFFHHSFGNEVHLEEKD